MVSQDGGGTAGGQDFHLIIPQLLREWNDPLLVRHADEGPSDFVHSIFLRGRVRRGCNE